MKKIWNDTRYLLFAGLILRLALPLVLGTNAYKGDGADYRFHADNLRRYGVYSGDIGSPPPPTYERMPGVPMEIFLMSSLVNYDSIWMLLPNVIMGWLSLVLLVGFFKQLKISGPASMAMLWLYALIPVLDYYASQFYPEVPAAFFTLLSLYIFLVWREKGNLLLLAGIGAASGMALYFRPELVLTTGIIGAYFLLKKESLSVRIKSAAVFASAVLLVLSPWIIRNARNEGKFIPLGSNQIFDVLETTPDSARSCTRGLYAWLNTWHWMERHSKLVAWDFMHVKFTDLPSSAFDSQEEWRQISALQKNKEYNCGIDKALMQIAGQKRSAHPFRHYVQLPLKRIFFLLFRVERFDNFNSDKLPPWMLTFAWILLTGFGNMMNAVGLFAAWNLRKRNPVFAIILASAILRLLFFAVVYHVETRYMLILFPEFFIVGTVYLSQRFFGK